LRTGGVHTNLPSRFDIYRATAVLHASLKENAMNQAVKLFAALGAAAMMGSAPTVLAQQSGLVNVDISNVANNIAKNINVDVSQIPVSIQVPIGVAANVCGVAANVLGSQGGSGSGGCTATTTSTALDQAVLRQIKGTSQQ
jgi:hypothetical protein